MIFFGNMFGNLNVLDCNLPREGSTNIYTAVIINLRNGEFNIEIINKLL